MLGMDLRGYHLGATTSMFSTLTEFLVGTAAAARRSAAVMPWQTEFAVEELARIWGLTLLEAQKTKVTKAALECQTKFEKQSDRRSN